MAHIAPYEGGRWRAVVRKAGYKVRSQIFPTKALAKGWAREIEGEMDSRRYKDPSKFAKDTVGSLFEKFRDEVCDQRKGGRWERVRINKLLREAEFMPRRITELQSSDLREWRNERLKQVSPMSVNREMNLMSKIFSHAIQEWGYPWSVNPIHEVSRPKGGTGKPRNRRWGDTELQALLTATNYDPERQPRTGYEHVAWGLLLMIETAMRPGEFCSAKVKDVNLARRYIRLHDSKNGDARDVPLSSKAVQMLTILVQGKRPEQTLFPVTSESLGKEYRDARKAAGLAEADLRFYDGKHEAISRLAPKFRDALELSKVTGHRDLRSLAVYYNPTVEELAAKLD